MRKIDKGSGMSISPELGAVLDRVKRKELELEEVVRRGLKKGPAKRRRRSMDFFQDKKGDSEIVPKIPVPGKEESGREE